MGGRNGTQLASDLIRERSSRIREFIAQQIRDIEDLTGLTVTRVDVDLDEVQISGLKTAARVNYVELTIETKG